MLTDTLLRYALLALCVLVFAAVAPAAGAAGPKMDEVAPGVWRLRFGQPEKNTPLRFRSAPARAEAMAALPTASMPLDLKQATFVRSARGCAVQLPLTKDENLFGFGLSPQVFNMTGRHIFTRPTDKPENALNDSHAPAPFYVSTQGYGVYVDTARYATFYTGNVNPAAKAQAASASNAAAATSTEQLYKPRDLAEKTMLIDVPSAHGVAVYVFAGPAMANAVQRYNLFSGGGVVPPLWGLGMFYRGLSALTAEESLSLAKSFREDKIPCDVWGLEPGWQTHTYSCSFLWNDKTFPDPDDFISRMGGMGYELSVWEHAFTHPTSPIYEPLKPYSGDYLVWSGLVPDFATKQARAIFQGQQEKALYSKGVRAVKLDECDNQPSDPHPWSFPEASVFPSGLDGEQMHSLIGVLYQQTMLEPLRKRNVRSWNLVRNSHALAAPLPFVLYSDTYDHKGYVRALANEGFSGLLWGPEVRDTSTIEDFYRRVETVIFSPLAQIDSWFLRMPPWVQINRAKNNAGEVMPESEKVTADMRRLFQLRMSLIPYLYSAFNDYYRTGAPPIRALVMDWPQDPNTYALDDQYMFGPSLMVAPLFAGQVSRTVYLPAGDWYDFWTHEKFTGGRKIEVSKPLDQIPVFVKGDTLMPLATPVEHFTLEIRYDLTVHVYGDRPVPFALYEDDGVSLDFERGAQNEVTLTWNGTGGCQTTAGVYTGPPRYRVVKWQAHP